MKNIRIFATYFFVLLLITTSLSCKNKDKQYNDTIKEALDPIRLNLSLNLSTDKMRQRGFYNVIYGENFEDVKEYGECGWVDSNPLMVVAEGFYNTYWRTYRGNTIPDPIPDIATFEALVAGGADLNMRPYIWDRVYLHTNEDLNRLWGSAIVNGKPEEVEEDMKAYHIRDANRIIEAFLKAGADPDMLGHPYPFSGEALDAKITDEQETFCYNIRIWMKNR